MRLFTKIPNHSRDVFFVIYVNNVESKINKFNLIYKPCASGVIFT
jgi:hypothetical protein